MCRKNSVMGIEDAGIRVLGKAACDSGPIRATLRRECFVLQVATAAPWKQSTWGPQSLEKWCCPTQMLLLGVARSGRTGSKGERRGWTGG